MPSWFPPILIFMVWCLWGVTAVVHQVAEDARNEVPIEQRHGVSIVPVIPIFPLSFWFLAWLIDLGAGPWGTIIVGAFHVGVTLLFARSLARDCWFMCSLGKRD